MERKIIVVVAAAIVVIAGVYVLGEEKFNKNNTTKANNGTITVTLIIDFGNYTWNYSMQLKNGSSVYDLLVEASHQHNFSISATYYPQYDSYLIEGINGVKGGNGKYWQYWVNGEYATVGANAFKLKNNDVVEWKLASYE